MYKISGEAHPSHSSQKQTARSMWKTTNRGSLRVCRINLHNHNGIAKHNSCYFQTIDLYWYFIVFIFGINIAFESGSKNNRLDSGIFMIFKKILVALLIGGGFVCGTSQASVAHLVLNGTVGDYITGGQTYDVTYSSADPTLLWNFARFNNIGTNTEPSTNNISFTFLKNDNLNLSDLASLNFSTRDLGVPLTVGSYFDAERAPFASPGHPGLSVFFDHRGCNTLSGDFTVNDLSFHNSQLSLFSVSFNQSCDGGAMMSGTFDYDANRTSFVPEPASIALFGIGLFGFALARRRKH